MEKRKKVKRTADEKLRILKDVQRLGVVAGCKKHGIGSTSYYEWLDKYESNGINGLSNNYQDNSKQLKAKDKEIRLLKEIIAEKELQLKLHKDLLKKKRLAWKKNEK